MFSKNWDPRICVITTLEAYINAIKINQKKQGAYIIGKTSDGTMMQIWVNSQKTIDRAYPLIKKNGASCCP